MQVNTHSPHQSFGRFLFRRFIGWLFAIPFYFSGLAITVWLVEPHNLTPAQELWAAAFPGMLVLFFLVQRHTGCASGQCHPGRRSCAASMVPEPRVRSNGGKTAV